MKIVKFFSYEGFLMGIILADVILIGQKNNYSFCMETTRPILDLELRDYMNVCVTELIQEIKQADFLYERSLIPQLEELIIQ